MTLSFRLAVLFAFATTLVWRIEALQWRMAASGAARGLTIDPSSGNARQAPAVTVPPALTRSDSWRYGRGGNAGDFVIWRTLSKANVVFCPVSRSCRPSGAALG